FPVLSCVNSKMIKNYLTSTRGHLVLGLKKKNLSEIEPERISHLINVLDGDFKYVFIILPDENNPQSLEIIKQSKSLIVPFSPDIMSLKKTENLFDFYCSLDILRSDIIPVSFEFGYDFNAKSILEGAEFFKNIIEIDFSAKTQKQIFDSRLSSIDFPAPFKAAVSEILKRIKNAKTPLSVNEIAQEQYFYNENTYRELSEKVYSLLIEEMKEFSAENDSEILKRKTSSKIESILKKLDLHLPQKVSQRLFKELCDDVAGLGVLEDLINDKSVTEIMVNGPNIIYVEKAGKITKSAAVFPDEKKLGTAIDRIVSQTGRHIDEASPIVDARLKDGSRVNAVIRPIALNGAALTIRKFLKNIHSADKLIEIGSLSAAMLEFLKTCVLLKRNIIISGGTGTGKTTLLNTISSFIPEYERLITIEDSAELQLKQEHVIRLEGRPKSAEGSGEISIRRLVVNSLRMRPDRIIVGECRSGEALDMLQAMNTGHEGSMSTIHANSEKDAVSRLTTMVMMSGADLPERAIVNQIISAVNTIVQLTRYFDGSRRISSISVLKQRDDEKIYEIMPVFKFNLSGVENGKQTGEFKACGFVPEFIKTASDRGVNINLEIFK
ncbi:MAG: Flp pilus assembly complex ATPase component TadA, partial [Elusimicrobiota bacterium]|nr:Flp pilus assembly complex ATPase component TadA [Elusimicrobiota bacterium]